MAAYDLENYERNEAPIQSQSQNQKIEEIQREIFNVKTELNELNKMTRYSFFLFGIVILLLVFIGLFCVTSFLILTDIH